MGPPWWRDKTLPELPPLYMDDRAAEETG